MNRARAERRKQLRAQVFDIDANRCAYPRCGIRAEELAHIHSIGAGGRRSADTISNCFAACYDHARLSDGQIPTGKTSDWYAEQLALIGQHPPYKAWNIAEALTSAVAKVRGFTIQ